MSHIVDISIRVISIVVVVGVIGFLGCWLSGPGGYGGRPLVRVIFPVAPDQGMQNDVVPDQPPLDGTVLSGDGAGIPLWPAHMALVEKTKLDREGVEGAIFTVEGTQRQQVVAYYRALLGRRGWHEMSSGEEAAAKAGLKAEGLYAFAGDGGTFFLGYDTDASSVHFVTMHLPRRSE